MLAVLDGHGDTVWSATFSPDGARVVTASGDKTARLWDAATGKAFAVLDGPDEPPRWCITGAGLEAERDPSKWQPLWPYRSAAWRGWLAARDRDESPALPQ